MKSRFRLTTYLVPIVFFGLLLLIPFFVFFSFWVLTEVEDPKMLLVLFFPLILLVSEWYLLYVVRFKCDVVTVEQEELIIKNFFGVGRKRFYSYQDLSLSNSNEQVKIGSGKKVLVHRKGKLLTEISDFSYSNYRQLIDSLNKRKPIQEFKEDSIWNRLQLAIKF